MGRRFRTQEGGLVAWQSVLPTYSLNAFVTAESNKLETFPRPPRVLDKVVSLLLHRS